MVESVKVEWNEYREPRSETASAVQFPLDERWSIRVLNAYLKDTGTLRVRQKGANYDR